MTASRHYGLGFAKFLPGAPRSLPRRPAFGLNVIFAITIAPGRSTSMSSRACAAVNTVMTAVASPTLLSLSELPALRINGLG
jgi:hypothetical protein